MYNQLFILLREAEYPVNVSKLFQRCLFVEMTSRRDATSNQRWNNVVYFNIDVSNVRQHRNNIVLFNFVFQNVGQRGNNVVKLALSNRKKKNNFKLNTLISKFLLLFHNLLHSTLNFKKNMLKNTFKAAKLRIMKNTGLQELALNRFTL